VGLPVTVPLLSVELQSVVKSDTQPTPSEGYEAILLKDLGYTKLWIIYKIIE
jgi:hypothetical protein